MHSTIAIADGVIYTGDEVIRDKAVLVEGDRIIGIVSREEVPSHIEIIEAHHANIAPGLIDLQIYGAGDTCFQPAQLPIHWQKSAEPF